MTNVTFKDMAETGVTEMYVLLKEVQEKESKNGSVYLSMTLCDGKMEIKANMWQTSKAGLGIDENSVVYAAIDASQYNGKPSFTIKRIRQATAEDDVNKSDFIPTAPVDPQILYDKCMDIVSEIEDSDLRQLASNIYTKYRDKLLHWGAAKAVHHNVVGGLLWHAYRMTCTVQGYPAIYPYINKDMVVAGTLLHDIGKLFELETDECGSSEYTLDGSLFGHLLMGVNIVREEGQKIGMEENKLKQLEHIIASHHGKQEYGAIALPATPEAFAVFMADMLDSRMYVYEKCLDALNPGEFSDRQMALDNARVYKF